MEIKKQVLNESKDNLPITILTDLAAQSWSQVGMLNDQIKAYKGQFNGAKKVVDILQDLADAYLVAAGQVESLLASKDYLDFSDDDKNLKESLDEDTNVNIDQVVINEPEVEVHKLAEPTNIASGDVELEEEPIIEIPFGDDKLPKAEVRDTFDMEFPEADTSRPIDIPDHITFQGEPAKDIPVMQPKLDKEDIEEVEIEESAKGEDDDDFFNMF